MKILKKIGSLLLVAIIIAQFFGPEKNEGDITAIEPFLSETNPPEDVKKILKVACFDCHSDVTRYPWYGDITPLNYWLADHVNHGKDELNFSDWSNFSLKKKRHKMKEVKEEVKKENMPLDSYTWTHFDARLTPEQIQAVFDWAEREQNKYNDQINTEQ